MNFNFLKKIDIKKLVLSALFPSWQGMIMQNSLAAIFIIAFGVVFRIILNKEIKIPNFESVTALSLLAGSFLGGIYSVLVPVFTIFLSDIYFGNTKIYIFTWSAFILIGVFGTMIKRNSRHYGLKMTGFGLVSVLFFYLYTNFGWWLTSGMYPMNLQGLIQSYIAGIPFLKNQLMSAAIFIPAFIPIFSFVFKKRESAIKILKSAKI